MPPPTPTPPPEARCVLLVGGGAVPSNLVAALGQRRIAVTLARAAPEVMAELAGGGVASVVVVEPERQDRADELRVAAGVYHPDVRFWAYAPQAPGREATLSVFAAASGKPDENAGSGANPWYPPAYEGQEATSAATWEPHSKAGPRPDAEPACSTRTGPNRPVEAADDDQTLVTEQELAMLLGTDSTPGPGIGPGRGTGSVRGHGRESGGPNGGEERSPR